MRNVLYEDDTVYKDAWALKTKGQIALVGRVQAVASWNFSSLRLHFHSLWSSNCYRLDVLSCVVMCLRVSRNIEADIV